MANGSMYCYVKCHNYDYILIIENALHCFVQAMPCRKSNHYHIHTPILFVPRDRISHMAWWLRTALESASLLHVYGLWDFAHCSVHHGCIVTYSPDAQFPRTILNTLENFNCTPKKNLVARLLMARGPKQALKH